MIRVDVLGGLRVHKNDDELTGWGSKRQRSAVLVYLAVEQETTREKRMREFRALPNLKDEPSVDPRVEWLYDRIAELDKAGVPATRIAKKMGIRN